jgi:cytochrome c556
MPLSPLIIALAALLALGAVAIAQDTPTDVVDPAIAGMTNEQLVEVREQAMEDNGRAMRGARQLGPTSVDVATLLLQNFTDFPALFREGSNVGGSKALPAIWENWDDFKARFDANIAASARMLAAAQANDAAAYTAAFREISQSCGSCHMDYRGRRAGDLRPLHSGERAPLLSGPFDVILRAMKTAVAIIVSIICC